ncbi:hypothetical protein MY1884_002319 [Beauveria asiatica]
MTLKMGLKIWNQPLDPFRTVAVISRFTEDLAAHKDIDTRVFGAAVLLEDADSCSRREQTRREERFVARPDTGNRCQLSVWAVSVDVEVARLNVRGVAILLGPRTKPWGKRKAIFRDPAGYRWRLRKTFK